MDSKSCYSLYQEDVPYMIDSESQKAYSITNSDGEEDQFLNANDEDEQYQFHNNQYIENQDQVNINIEDNNEDMFLDTNVVQTNYHEHHQDITNENINQIHHVAAFDTYGYSDTSNQNTYDTYISNRQIQDIKNDMEDTTNILRDNIHRVHNRGDKLDAIESETEKLIEGSNKFRQRSNELRKKMLVKYLVHIFCLAFTVIFIIVLIMILLRK